MGAEGYWNLTTQEDELTEIEQQELLEKQRQEILAAIDAIESTEYKTKSDVSNFIRYNAYLQGDDSYQTLTDDQLINQAKATGHPMVGEIYEPGAADIAKVKSIQFYNNLRYNTPAMMLLNLRDSKKEPSSRRVQDTMDPAVMREISDELRPGSALSVPDYGTRVYDDNNAYTAYETQQFKQLFKLRNPKATEDEINFQVSAAKEKGAVFNTKATEWLHSGIEDLKHQIEDNPKHRATAEWLSTELETIDNAKEFGKWVENVALDVGLSVTTILGAGWASAKLAGKAAGLTTALFPTVGEEVPVTLATSTIAGMIGSGIVSGGMMGGGALKENFVRLTNDEQLTKEQHDEMIEFARSSYDKKYGKGKFFHKGLGRVTNQEEMLKLFKSTHLGSDGQNYWRKGVSDEEAIEMISGTANWSFTMGVLIEQFSAVGKAVKHIPGVNRIAPHWIKHNMITRMSDKVRDRAALIPKGTAKNRAKAWFMENSVESFSQLLGESAEEVTQGISDALAEVYTPVFSDIGLMQGVEKMYYAPKGFADYHGGWTQYRDEFFGGLFGAGPAVTLTAGQAIKGVNEKKFNRGILRTIKKKGGSRFGIDRAGKDENGNDIFRIVNYYTEKDDDTGKTTVEKKTDLSDMVDAEGNTFQTEYTNFQDAYEGTKRFEEQTVIVGNTQRAWQFKDIRKGSTNVIKNEDGTYQVQILDNGGKVFRTDEKKYKKKYFANRVATKLTYTLKNLDENYSRYNVSKDNKIVRQFEKDKNVQKKKIRNKIVTDLIGTDASMAIAAFMEPEFKGEGADKQAVESYDRAVNEEGILVNPDAIIRHINNDKDNNILVERGHTPETLLKMFDTLFGPKGQNIPNYESKVKELKTALGITVTTPKTTTKEVGPVIEEGPATEEGPSLERRESDIGAIEEDEGPPVREEGPQEELFPEEGPSKKKITTKRAPKRKPVTKLAKRTTEDLEAQIETLKTEIPNIKEGTTQRTFAEKKLVMLQKEVDSRKEVPTVKKIISGGQVGTDELGLEVGRELGLETGGTAPPGFIQQPGGPETRVSSPELLKGYGLTEGKEDDYIFPKRTRKNVKDSDGTVIFADNVNSRGTKLTIGAAKKNKKPYIVNPTASELKSWMSENNIEILNVAGNRAMKPEQVKPILKEALGKKKAPKERKELVTTKPTEEEMIIAKTRAAMDKKKALVKPIVDKLFNTFDGTVNIHYEENPTSEQAGSYGWYDRTTNTVNINLAHPRLSENTPAHEFSHPFLGMLRKENPELFNSLYEEAIGIDSALRDRVEFAYRKEIEEGRLSEDGIKEEVLAFTLEEALPKEFNERNKFWNVIKRFFNYIKQRLGFQQKDEVFSLLTPKTKLRDIARFIVNNENKYKITIDDKEFSDEAVDFADADTPLISDIVETTHGSVSEAISVAEENALINHLSGELEGLTSDELRNAAIEKVTKWIEKSYKLRTSKYKGKAVDKAIKWATKKDATETQISDGKEATYIKKRKLQIIDTMRKDLSRHLPKVKSIDLDNLASAVVALEGKIEFTFALAEKILIPRYSKQSISVNDLLNLKTEEGAKLKSAEKENVKEFQKYYKDKFDINKKINGLELASMYIDWSNRQMNLTAIHSNGYNNELEYKYVGEGYERNIYRMLIINNKTISGFKGYPIAHTFEELGPGDRQGPLGWYTILIKNNGDILLHEYQSDIIPETMKGLKELAKTKGIEVIDIEADKTPVSLIDNFIKSGDITYISDIIRQQLTRSGDIDIFRWFKNTRIDIDTRSEDLIGSELWKDLRLNFNYMHQTVDKMLKSIVADLNLFRQEIKPTREEVRQILDSYIGKFGENLELSLAFVNVDNNLLELKQHINALKVKKYRNFPVHSVKNRIVNVALNYGNLEYSKQERKDLLEVTKYFNIHKPANEQFFENFENKDNSFYKWLLRLDNIQRHERYNKDRFQYNPHFINSAFLDTMDSNLGTYVSQIIKEDGGWNKDYADMYGNKKPIRDANGKTVWNLLKIQRRIKHQKNEYMRKYRLDRTVISKGEMLLALPIGKELENVLASSYKYYLNETMRMAASRILLGDIITEDTSVSINYDDMIPKLSGYKYALEMQNSLIPNWFGRTIMHSIKHANMTKGPDNNIYLSSGSSIALIEKDISPAKIYFTEKEAMWYMLTRGEIELLEDQDAEPHLVYWDRITKEDFALIEKKLKKAMAPFGRFTNEFLKNFGKGDDNSILYGKQVEPLNKHPFGKVMATKDQVKLYDIVLDVLTNESKNKEKWKDAFKKHARPGIFYKELKKLSKNKDTGFEIETVYPDWSDTPLIKVNITDDSKLTPVMWKKELPEIRNAKDLPANEQALEVNLKNTIELKDLNVRTQEYKIIKGFFDDAWRKMQILSGKKKVDIDDFKSVINHVIKEPLVPAFEKWWEKKFAGQEELAYRKREVGKDKYVFLNQEDMNIEFQPMYSDWSQGTEVKKMLEQGVRDERKLTLNDLLYFRALKKTITLKQLETLAALTFTHKTYKSWKEYTLKHILSVSLSLTNEQESELHKHYNRINSIVRTNRDGQASTNQKDNFVVQISSEWDKNSGTYVVKSLKVTKKGVENIATGNENNRYEKITLFEANIPGGMGLFSWISGGDVLGDYNLKDVNGETILVRDKKKPWKKTTIPGWRPQYGFLKPEVLIRLESYVRKMGYTIAFPRGDSDRIALVEVKKEHHDDAPLSKAKEFWNKEIEDLAETNEELELLKSKLPELLSGDTMDRAATIAIHKALKQVFPRYLLDPKGGTNVYKRLKIPFTPVTRSDEMPPIRVDKFNPEEVMFQVGDGKPFSPWVYIKQLKKSKYIGDGNSISSQLLFDLFEEYHGLRKTTAKAKTVIYEKDGNDVLAIKHQHILPKRNLKILDKKGNVLYAIDNKRNIKDADGNDVHMLVTNDEVKIGDLFRGGNTLQVSGQSIGFIKYDEQSKSTVKHIMQWYNYVQSDEVLRQFKRKYGVTLGTNIQKAFLTVISDDKSKASKKIKDFLLKFSGKDNEGFSPDALEKALLNAGNHPALEGILDVLLQTQSVNPALNLSESEGSIYDISMDMSGELEPGEVSLGIQNSKMIKNYIGLGDAASIAEINKYLENNEVYVMVTRSPVAHIGGAYMARVKSLHSRRSLADLNAEDVFVKLEGDGDGDEVHIEMLDDATRNIYQKYMKEIKDIANKGLNLDRFVTKKIRSILTRAAREETMNSLIAGSTAIAEIANIASIYGMMNKIYSGFRMGDYVVSVRNPGETISFPEATFDGKKGSWSGTVEEYLRLWLQAAVDNNEYGLLYDWNYNQKDLLSSLFKYTSVKGGPQINGLPPGGWSQVEMLANYFKDVLSVRRGYNFKKGRFRLSDTMEVSKSLYNMALDRESFNQEGFQMIIKNPVLTPYELVAIAPFRVWESMSRDMGLIGFEGPGKLVPRVHKNAHKYARDYIKGKLEGIWIDAMELDLELGYWDGKNDKKYVSNQVAIGKKYVRGRVGHPGMGMEFYKMLLKIKKLGHQSLDRNAEFIDWKDKWSDVFDNLSKTAQIAATLSFLRGYRKLVRNLEQNKGTQYPKILPSVSSKSSEPSLLDPGLMEAFFEKYNEYIDSKNPDSLLKLIENSSETIPIGKSAIKACRGT